MLDRKNNLKLFYFYNLFPKSMKKMLKYSHLDISDTKHLTAMPLSETFVPCKLYSRNDCKVGDKHLLFRIIPHKLHMTSHPRGL